MKNTAAMFESLLENLLLDRLQLGDWIQDLDRSQLKLGVWSGHIELSNLRLNLAKINKLSPTSPFVVSFGLLKKFEIKLPWKSLLSSPTEVC